jgi:adenine phosphoribosyltransferase
VPHENIRAAIRDVPDFPKPGIVFKDIAPVLGDPECFRSALDALQSRWRTERIDVVCAVESRGFIFGAPLADRLGCAFVPVRKPGKLPWRTRSVEYTLEYGTDSLEIHDDAFRAGSRVLIVDDLLATGGTAQAAGRLVALCGGEVAGYAFLVHLSFLGGLAKLGGKPVQFLVEY